MFLNYDTIMSICISRLNLDARRINFTSATSVRLFDEMQSFANKTVFLITK